MKLIQQLFVSTFLLVVAWIAPANAENFRVGFILPLSGPLVEYGVAIKNGVMMAQTEHPELFKDITILYEDSQYDSKRAVTAFQKLAQIDHANLVYNFGGPTSEAIAPLAERMNVPLFVWTTDTKAAAGRKFVVRFTNSAGEFSQMLHNYLKAKGYKKFGVVRTENQYLNSLYDAFKEQLSAEESVTVVDSYQFGDNDFRSTVAKIRNSGYDAVGVYLMSGQVSLFYRQALAQDVHVPTFGTDFFESQTEIEGADGGMDGAVYANNSVAADFYQRYLKQFGNDLQISYAGNGHDFATLVGTLFNTSTDKLTNSQIMDRFIKSGPQQGVLGMYEYALGIDKDQHFKLPVLIKNIEKGKITEVKTQ